jgi:KUP system potassium uptake protein
VLGILSLIFWSLVRVICVKYVAFVTRADNNGEGGVLALLSLTRAGTADRAGPRGRFILLLLGLFGTALLYGDGMITPAISVLSAVEGLQVATRTFEPYVLPITVAILFGLFAVQSRGTAKVAAVFGPALLVWFCDRCSRCAPHPPPARGSPERLPRNESALRDPLPHRQRPLRLALSSVVLVVTGGEALYADMGHFGARRSASPGS